MLWCPECNFDNEDYRRSCKNCGHQLWGVPNPPEKVPSERMQKFVAATNKVDAAGNWLIAWVTFPVFGFIMWGWLGLFLGIAVGSLYSMATRKPS